MTMRVAMLAAECEPWAKTGGLADVVDALARALGRLPEAGTELDAPVDVFLPRYRSVPVPADAVTEPVLSIADPDLARRGATLDVSIVERGRRRLPAAPGRRARRVRPRRVLRLPRRPVAVRGVLPRGARGAASATAGPLDVLHVHDWHTGPALLERARADAAGDPFLAGRPSSPRSTTSPTTAGRASARSASSACAPASRSAGANPDGIDLLLTAIERSEIANTVSPGLRRARRSRPAFGMGLDGALRAKGNRFLGILNGIDPDVWDPADRPGARRAVLARRPGGQGRLPARPAASASGFDPDDDGVVLGMIGRMDPQKGFDLLADGDAGAARRRGAGDRAGERPRVARRPVPGAGGGASPRRVALIERFDREMARRIYAGVGPVPDAVALRALRAGPDDRAALRDAARRPPDRRPGGLRGRRRPSDRSEGTGFVFDDATPGGAGRVDRAGRDAAGDGPDGVGGAPRPRAWPSTSAGTPAPAPRYLAAYRRAIALRRGEA